MLIGYLIDQVIDIQSYLTNLPICTVLYDMYQAVLLQPTSS